MYFLSEEKKTEQNRTIGAMAKLYRSENVEWTGILMLENKEICKPNFQKK